MLHRENPALTKIIGSKVESSILDAIAASFCVIDRNGDYIVINDIAAKRISGILNAQLVDQVGWESCKLAMEKGERIMVEEFFEGKWYLAVKQPLFDHEKCVGVMVLSFDITARKQEQEKITQLAQAKTAILHEKASNLQMLSHYLTQELSHAFNNVKNRVDALQFSMPLIGNVAVGMKVTKIRRHQLLGVIDTIWLMKKALDSAAKLCDITSVNLRMAKIRKDKFTICSIADALCIAIRDYPFQECEGKLLHCDFGQAFYFHGIEVYATHVFINLLKNSLNAIKTANRGEIWIKFITCEVDPKSKKQRFHRVMVKDTAAGISQDFMPKLFMPFTSCGDGMGLGLAFCKTVMQSFGGDITCDSQLGKYAEFTLWFPVGGF